MSSEVLVRLGPSVISSLALLLSLLNLYLQRRDRVPRLGIRARYEYRAEGVAGGDSALLELHDCSQERLYLLLGDFLREYGLEYPKGQPLVRFALSNEGTKTIYLENIHLRLRSTRNPFKSARRVLDLKAGKIVPLELAGQTANILHTREETPPVEILPGDSAGYKFELSRISNLLQREGHAGNARLVLEAKNRVGKVYRRPFEVNTDMWSYIRQDGKRQ